MSSAKSSLMPTRLVAKRRINDASKPMRVGVTGRRSSSSTMLCLVFVCTLLCKVDAFVPQRQKAVSRSSCLLCSTSSSSNNNNQQQLGFLSFDLDDTLFPTNEVVNQANDHMIRVMNEAGVSTTLPEFLATTRAIRQALERPVTYTDLRKLAIAHQVEEYLGQSKSKSNDDDGALSFSPLVEDLFTAWLDERHSAAEQYLFDDAIETLRQIREQHPDVCIAAITNGRGSPLDMRDTLEPYFEFCVSGEDAGVFPARKPDAGIYEHSLQRYQELYPHHHDDSSDKRIWCHVGDCLANDVGASAAVGAKAVWFSTETPDEADAQSVASKLTPQWSTASQADREERAKQAAAARERIAVRISNLSELPGAIEDLLLSSPATVQPASSDGNCIPASS